MSRVDTGTLLVVSVVVGGTGDSNDDERIVTVW
jgi:hypothetical protein